MGLCVCEVGVTKESDDCLTEPFELSWCDGLLLSLLGHFLSTAACAVP